MLALLALSYAAIPFRLHAADGTHYGNPFNGPCQSDETTIKDAGGSICAAQCGLGHPKCPTDKPSTMTAKPKCFHSIGLKEYCVPLCEADADCGTGGACASEGNSKECRYTKAGPSPGPSPPGPSPSPTPPPPKGTHYGDPYDVACQSDELNVTVTGVAGAFCSPKCTGQSCPTDVPAGVTAQPKCALESQGKKTPDHCVLVCPQSGEANPCGPKASCKTIQGGAICTYDDGPAPAPAPAPSPRPPAPPAPAPGPAACSSCKWAKVPGSPLATILVGVGMGGPSNAYAGVAYANGASNVMKTTDGGETFTKLKTANGTLILLDTEAQSPTKAASSGLFGAEYTLNGQDFERSIVLGGGQDLEKFGTKGYAMVDEGGILVSKDGGIGYSKHTMTGIDIQTYPPRYGSFPSDNVWYISMGQFPSASSLLSSADWRTEKQLTETFHIRRNLTTGALYPHLMFPTDLRNNGVTDGQYTAGIAKTADGGATWTQQFASKGSFYFNDIDCVSETHCVAVAEGHDGANPGVHIFTTVDGTNWYPTHSEADAKAGLMGVRMVSETEVFASGGELTGLLSAKIYHSVNGGFNFTVDKPAGLVGTNGMDLDCTDGSHCFAAAVTVTKQMTLLVFK